MYLSLPNELAEQFARFCYQLGNFTDLSNPRLNTIDTLNFRISWVDRMDEFCQSFMLDSVPVPESSETLVTCWRFLVLRHPDRKLKTLSPGRYVGVIPFVVREAFSELMHKAKMARFVVADGVIRNSDDQKWSRLHLSKMSSKPLLLSLRNCYLPTADFDELCSTGNLALLEFLDVSYSTSGVPDSLWIPGFEPFRNLRVLRLRRCQFLDKHFRGLLVRKLASSYQLSTLDLRDNELTDNIGHDLLDMLPPSDPCELADISYTTSDNGLPIEAPPAYQREMHQYTGEAPELQRVDPNTSSMSDTVDEFIQYRNQCGDHDIGHWTGLRRLLLSGNTEISLRTLLRLLLRRSVLEVLDMDCSLEKGFDASKHSIAELGSHEHLEKSVIPVIVVLTSYKHAPKLRRLTIDHSFVTHRPRLVAGLKRDPAQYIPYVFSWAKNNKAPLYHQYFKPEINQTIEFLELANIPPFGKKEILDGLVKLLKGVSVQQGYLQTLKVIWPTSPRKPRVLNGLRQIKLVFRDIPPEASVTEDEDAERFIRESMNDFSFFEGENKPALKAPASIGASSSAAAQLVDIKSGLRKYRAETKARYELERSRLGVGEKNMPLGAPHFFYTGTLTVVTKEKG